MRLLLPPFVLVLALLTAVPPTAAEPIAVEADAIPLEAARPERRRVGKLLYRGGLRLTSPARHFGGFSALWVSDDGRHLLALGDRGRRLAARLDYDTSGDLSGLGAATIERLVDEDGSPLGGKGDADAEALAPDAGGGGGFTVAFERRHRLWRYGPDWSNPATLTPPRELALAPTNGGIEALARLADGRLVAFAEGIVTAGGVVGWVGGEGGEWSMLALATDGRFAPTGAARLPDGDLVVLLRRYSLFGGFGARLERVHAVDVRPGARLEGWALAEIAAPLLVDNFEGVAARRGGRGETLIYLLSDDNFSDRQSTLLLMFEILR